VNLKDLRGTPTVLNVWAAWCTNCDREMPLFAAAMDKAGAKLRFFGVHYKATRAQGRASEDDFGVPFPSVHDADGDRTALALKATAPPQTFFVAADGKVVGHEVGEITSQAELDELIERHLGVRL
jgi:thiol-disulfide isomerase/thioredoxin